MSEIMKRQGQFDRPGRKIGETCCDCVVGFYGDCTLCELYQYRQAKKAKVIAERKARESQDKKY